MLPLIVRTPFQFSRKVFSYGRLQYAQMSSEIGSNNVPRRAQVVICGGGVVGVSVAYHLAARGVTEVVLLERGRLGCGTTWHAAGIVGAMRQSDTQTQLVLYGQNLYRWMDQNGYPTGFKQCGSVNIASTVDRLTEMRRAADRCRVNDIPVFEISPAEVKERVPFVNTEDIQGGFWLPTDGAASPLDVCQSLAKMAVEKGAQLIEGCEVLRVLTSKQGSVSGVETSLGNIQCQQFVLCGGMWSRSLAAQTIPSVPLPLQATEHFYLVTQPMQDIDVMTPVVRDADASVYAREWSGGFLVGVFEKPSLPVFPDGPPNDFQFQLFPDNWEHFQPHYDPIAHRFPFLKTVEVRHMTNGPESFTEDGTPMIGEVAEVPGFMVATGMNSRGISLGGGVGRTMAEIIIDGVPSVDCSELDVKRFFPKQNSQKHLWTMGKSIVGEVYSLHYPKHFHPSDTEDLIGFPKLLKDLGAVFGTVNNRNIPLWFSKSQQGSHIQGTFGKPAWFESVLEEMAHCRDGLAFANTGALIGALTLSGPSTNIDKLFVNTVCGLPTSSVKHTALLNGHGQYVAKCVIVVQGHDSYLMLFPRSCERHLVSWLKKQREGGVSFQLLDDRESFALLGAKPLLDNVLTSQAVLPKDNSALTCTLGNKASLLLKVPWLPSNHVFMWTMAEGSESVYKYLLEGSGGSLRPVGLYCLDALRTEEGIPWWGQELNSASTPLTAGLAKQIFNESKNFIGKSALARGSGSQKVHSLIHFMVEGIGIENAHWPWGGEPIYVAQRHVGEVSSISYSPKRSAFNGLALVQLDKPWDQRQMEIVTANKRYRLKAITEK